MTDEQIRAEIATVPHWYHRIEIRPGIVTPGINDSPLVLRHLQLPDDCSGLRALDLGARDGFFSFELERRGAEVLAVDYMPPELTGFSVASRLVGSRVPYLHQNLYHLDPEKHETFDIVLFLGLLYHLPDPLGALRIIRSLCKSRMILETLIIDHGMLMPDGSQVSLADLDPRLATVPVMRFFPGDAMGKDPTNYWGPNIECVKAMLGETEFAPGRVVDLRGRAIFDCRVTSHPDLHYILAQSSGLVV
jgi:tRNA (mo5U34)-methyltransferase